MTAPTPDPDSVDVDAVVNRLGTRLAEAHVRIAVLESQLDAERAARQAAAERSIAAAAEANKPAKAAPK